MTSSFFEVGLQFIVKKEVSSNEKDAGFDNVG